MRRAIIYAVLILPVLALAWGVSLGTFPLGVPGEWEWSRVAPSDSLFLALLPAIVGAGLYVGFAWLGAQSISRCGRRGTAAWLGGLAAAGFAWLWVAQESAPENFQLSKAAWVLYYRGPSGYFSEARDLAGDLPQYLAGYEQKMTDGDVLHIGTHPPGLVVAMRGLIGLCRSAPAIVDLLAFTESASARAAFDELKKREPLSPIDRAVLWLAFLVVQTCASLTVIPLFGLCRMSCSRRASWQATAFWPAVPALALFLPKSDCLFPLLAMTFLWLWLQGLARRSLWMSALAGLVMWLGVSLSLAFLPIGLIAFLAGFWTADRAQSGLEGPLIRRSEPPVAVGWLRPSLRRLLPPCASAVAVIAAMTVAVGWLGRLNLLLVWKLNYENHSGFYRHYSRTYWKWILLNPVEFAVAAGFPLVALAVWSLMRSSRRAGPPSVGYARAWLLTMALLWLSGKNMGEAARLWTCLIPFLPWIAAPLFEGGVLPADTGALRGPLGSIADPADSKAIWPVALGLQLVSTAWLVTQVAGFHLPQAVPVVANLPAP